MRFHAEHRFRAPAEAVIGLLVDPAFHRQLELPDVSLLDADGSTEGDRSHLTLRYEFVGSLDPIARRLLAGRDLTWRQALDIDRSTGAGRLSFQAEAIPAVSTARQPSRSTPPTAARCFWTASSVSDATRRRLPRSSTSFQATWGGRSRTSRIASTIPVWSTMYARR